jgi:hypothetical protein
MIQVSIARKGLSDKIAKSVRQAINEQTKEPADLLFVTFTDGSEAKCSLKYPYLDSENKTLFLTSDLRIASGYAVEQIRGELWITADANKKQSKLV